MVMVAGYNNSFVSGEIGPEAWERSDLQQHATGCEQALNFIGLVSGPNASRGGLVRRGAPKFNDKARKLFQWNRSDGEGLVLEIGHLYGRVWTARGVQLETSPGTAVEFVHPYTEAQLPGLRLSQIGDIGFFTQRDGIKWKRIERLSDISWSVGDYTLKDGPYLRENTDLNKVMTLTDSGTGFWTIATNFDIFQAGHIGAIFRIRGPSGAPGVMSWAPNTAFVLHQRVLSAGRIYSWEGGGPKTGNTPPNHDRGTVSDGMVDWEFRYDGQGYIQIDGVTDLRNARAQVPYDLPIATGDSTTNWSEQAFSDVQGWPTALAAIREERLVLAGSKNAPDTVRLSRTAGFTPDVGDFKPGLGTGQVVDDDSVALSVGGKHARIIWAVDTLNLVAGTTEGEWIISGGQIDDPISPASNAPRRISGHGSADVMPVVVQGPPVLLLHVERGGIALRELLLAGANVEPQGRDLSVLAGHIYGRRVTEMAWSQPDHNLWLLLADGGLAAMTYHYEEQVLGARRQPLPTGWMAESVATSPDPDGVDRLHVAAWRMKGDVLQRAHLVLARREDNIWLDISAQYAGAPTATISGLSHFEGESVCVIADGGLLEDQVVTGGLVHVPDGTVAATVGQRMLRRFKSLPFDPDKSGAQVAKKARPINAYVVWGGVTAKLYAEPQDEPTDSAPLFDTVETRRPGDAAPVVRRKRSKVILGGGADRDMRTIVECDDPFDLVIYALRPSQDET